MYQLIVIFHFVLNVWYVHAMIHLQINNSIVIVRKLI
jgi:hypothetical protein